MKSNSIIWLGIRPKFFPQELEHHLVMCTKCGSIKFQHIGGRCLYSSTLFNPELITYLGHWYTGSSARDHDNNELVVGVRYVAYAYPSRPENHEVSLSHPHCKFPIVQLIRDLNGV